MGGAPPRNIKVVEVFPPGGGAGDAHKNPLFGTISSTSR